MPTEVIPDSELGQDDWPADDEADPDLREEGQAHANADVDLGSTDVETPSLDDDYEFPSVLEVVTGDRIYAPSTQGET